MPKHFQIAVSCFLLFIYAANTCRAQEKLGIANSNYMSTSGIFLNPAASVDSKTYMQCNLIGINVFAMNNIAYLPKFWFPGLIKGDDVPDQKTSSLKVPKFFYAAATVDGPAFVISKRDYGAGVFIRARSVGGLYAPSIKLVGAVIDRDKEHKTTTSINARNTRAATMTWLEYGLNFGKMIKRNRNILISMGGNVRYLTGMHLWYANVVQVKGAYNDTMIRLDDFKARVRYTNFGWNIGRGVGMDVGFTYKKMLSDVSNYYVHSTRNNCTTIDYKYKIGLTLRDLGFIRFTENTHSANADGAGLYDKNRPSDNFQSPLETIMSMQFAEKPINASLPTALVGQVDWNFENKIYLNGTIIKNIVPSRLTGVQGPDLLSICPRFELRQFEAAMPLTLQRYIYPQLGLTLRYRTFVLGTDNFLFFVMPKNTYGVNIYFSLGFSIFRNHACYVKPRFVANCSKQQTQRPKKDKANRPPRKRKR